MERTHIFPAEYEKKEEKKYTPRESFVSVSANTVSSIKVDN